MSIILGIYFFLAFASQTFAGHIFADEVCYEPLGCFSDQFPFTSINRPIAYLPWSPEEIGTSFWLYTRFNQFSHQLLSYDDPSSITKSNYSPFKKTKIIIHGYTANGDDDWIVKLKNALINAENLNVIVVDWHDGASAIYGQAATNTRVVGAQIQYLIKTIKEQTGALSSDFHLIGHSLGAHTAGYAGERLLMKLGRITGLDAADPYFQGTPWNVRLDPSDATFVDAIHTDGDPFFQLGWGMIDPVAHADFYPNGGYDQPGCPGNDVESGGFWKLSCSHSRAHELMIDSILSNDKPMYGYRCDSYSDYLDGACKSCDSAGCPTLGYYSDQVATSDEENVKYFLTTGSEAPYSVINP